MTRPSGDPAGTGGPAPLTPLTPAQTAAYRRDGFLVLEDLLAPDELGAWRAALGEAVEQRLAALAAGRLKRGLLGRHKSGLRHLLGRQRIERARRLLVRLFGKDIAGGALGDALLTNQAEPDSHYARVLVVCQRLADTHTGVRAIALAPRLGRLAASLMGAESVRYYHDQALIKPPFGGPTAYHVDNPTWAFHDRRALTLWVALDDADAGNGCLWYLPGTHRAAVASSVHVAAGPADLFRLYPQWREIAPVACPLRAGSAVVHNGYIAHGAGANMTNRARRALTVSFMPGGAAFSGNRDVLPGGYFRALRAGDRLDDDAVFPPVWPT